MSKKTTFVLVHGAWHGGWCWKKVSPILRASGHEVFTPTLTGLGERSHLLNPQLDLSTHIQDIASVLEYEDLHDVVLVGHSYGGMVIAGVAEKARKHLAQLIYLDAILPEYGKSFKDNIPFAPLDDVVQTYGDGWRIPLQGRLEDFGIRDSDDITWMTSRIGDHPYKTLTQPAQFSATADDKIKSIYIQLSETPWSAETVERAKKKGFAYYKLLSGGHDAMVTIPKQLAEILLNLI